MNTNNFTENLTFGQRSKEGRGGSSERDTHSRQQRASANSPRQGYGWPSKGSGGRGRALVGVRSEVAAGRSIRLDRWEGWDPFPE